MQMSSNHRPSRVPKLVVVSAMALGLAAGSYGVASAASGSASGSTSKTSAAPARAAAAPSAPNAQNPWGGQRRDETPLTGDDASKATAAALAKVPGATIVRVETDADGHAP